MAQTAAARVSPRPSAAQSTVPSTDSRPPTRAQSLVRTRKITPNAGSSLRGAVDRLRRPFAASRLGSWLLSSIRVTSTISNARQGASSVASWRQPDRACFRARSLSRMIRPRRWRVPPVPFARCPGGRTPILPRDTDFKFEVAASVVIGEAGSGLSRQPPARVRGGCAGGLYQPAPWRTPGPTHLKGRGATDGFAGRQ
jgi:hypothetical protein